MHAKTKLNYYTVNFKVTKLDKRHAWRDQFKYMLTFDKRSFSWGKELPGVLYFDSMCQWLVEGFGWTQNVKTREKMQTVNRTVELNQQGTINEHWSYSTDYDDFRIYLDEQAMTLVKLKWITQ